MERSPIDLATAIEQHRSYERMLEKLGTKVLSLPADPQLPDSIFVEDAALVLDEVAVILPLGTPSRRAEAASIAAALAPYRQLRYVEPPGTAEGGDILRVDKKLFVGLSTRTNEAGIRQLETLVDPLGYAVTDVLVTGCLHLKSAVTLLGRNVLLANREWFDHAKLSGYEWIDVAPEEPHAANALCIGNTVLLAASFPKTRALIEAEGFEVLSLDISELQKAEAGLTCSSLLFSTP